MGHQIRNDQFLVGMYHLLPSLLIANVILTCAITIPFVVSSIDGNLV